MAPTILPAGGSTGWLNTRFPDPVYPGYAGVHVLIETRIGLTLLQLRFSVLCGAPPEFGGIQAMTLWLPDLHGKPTARLKGIKTLCRRQRRSQEQAQADGQEGDKKLNYIKRLAIIIDAIVNICTT